MRATNIIISLRVPGICTSFWSSARPPVLAYRPGIGMMDFDASDRRVATRDVDPVDQANKDPRGRRFGCRVCLLPDFPSCLVCICGWQARDDLPGNDNRSPFDF